MLEDGRQHRPGDTTGTTGSHGEYVGHCTGGVGRGAVYEVISGPPPHAVSTSSRGSPGFETDSILNPCKVWTKKTLAGPI